MKTILLLTLLLSTTVFAQTWQYSTKQDPFTDKPNHSAIVVKDNNFVAVKCESGGFPHLVVGTDYWIGSERNTLGDIRIDKNEPLRIDWFIQNDGVTVYASHDRHLATIEQLKNGREVVIRLVDFRLIEHIRTFPLAGSSNAISRVMVNCNIEAQIAEHERQITIEMETQEMLENSELFKALNKNKVLNN